jgi:hypothetical protein
MLSALASDPILKRLRAALDELYGDRIERRRAVRLPGAW